MPLVTNGLIAHFDVSDANGIVSGKLKNLEPTPEDGQSQTAYDYWLGTNGTSYAPSVAGTGQEKHLLFNGSQFCSFAGTMTDFLKQMHYAASTFTIEMWVYYPGTAGGNINPFFDSGTTDQGGSDMSRGVIFADQGSVGSRISGRINLGVKRDSSAVNAFYANSDASYQFNAVRHIAVSYGGNGSVVFFTENGEYKQINASDTAAISGTFGTSVSSNSKIGARGDANACIVNGSRVYVMRLYNRALTQSELYQNVATEGPRFGYNFWLGTISGNVKNHLGANTQRTLRFYERSTGILLGETLSDPTTGNYSFETTLDAPHTVIVLDDDAGDLKNALIKDRITPVEV